MADRSVTSNSDNSEVTVVKVGTSAITDHNGNFARNVARLILRQIEALQSHDPHHEFIIVSSGAIGLGMKKLGLTRFPEDTAERQRCSLFGLYELVHSWQEVTDRPVSGHWITHDMFESRQKLTNFHHGIKSCLAVGGIPVINENDGISVEEIERKFGDNDQLAASIAVDLRAKRLIILSNVPGLFNKNPEQHHDAVLIEEVEFGEEVPVDIDGKSAMGRGGMSAKKEAIESVTARGIPVYLTRPDSPNCLDVDAPDFSGTRFKAKGE